MVGSRRGAEVDGVEGIIGMRAGRNPNWSGGEAEEDVVELCNERVAFD